MALTAVYVGNYPRKEGKHQGKTFHVYYPRKSATGEPQMHTMYMDALRDELPLYKKQNGDFTLDQSETRKDMSRMELLQEVAPVMATAFANKLADKVFGAGKVSSSTANAFIPEPVSSGDDSELNEDM